MAAMGQREMRGAIGNRERGGGNEIHRIGDRHHGGGVEYDFLGVAAAVAQHREHPLPGLQAVDRAAGLDDLAGGFEPRGKGERRFHLIGAAHHQAVGEVHPGGAHPDAHLVRLEAWALTLLEPQHIGRAPFPATDRLHFLAPRDAPIARADDIAKRSRAVSCVLLAGLVYAEIVIELEPESWRSVSPGIAGMSPLSPSTTSRG